MDLQPGQVLLNRYEFVRVLGQGAMGEVLEVRDRYSGIAYALKRIPPEKAFGAAQMESVRANFALVSRLSHPHIATTRHLEFDPQSGHLLVLMDLVHGITLADWIAKERQLRGGPSAPLPLELALSIAGQIAEALDYAHELPISVDSQGRPKGILHRDLKPANVMIEERSGSSTGSHTVRLVDFGLAAEIQTTLTGMSIDPHRRDARNKLAGTLLYMAPEQYTAGTLTRGVDQWALAVIVYEMLAGRRPFEAESMDAITEKVLHPDPAPVPGLNAMQWQALKTAFSLDRRQRHPTCRSLIEAIRHGAGTLPATLPNDGRTPPPPPLLPFSQPEKPASRLPVFVALGVVFLFLAGLAGVGAAAWYVLRDDALAAAVKEAEDSAVRKDWSAVLATLDRPLADASAEHPRRARAQELVGNAAYELGKQLREAKDSTSALPYLKRAADAGNAEARYQLGLMYLVGEGAAADPGEAERLWTEAAGQQHAGARNELGVLCEKRRDYAKALEFYRQAAEGDNPYGQFNYGRFFYEGLGQAADKTKAFPWLLKAADRNHATAQSYVGWMYWKGEGVGSNPVKGAEYITRAANQNIAVAQFNLGVLYENGIGLAKDAAKALEWYQKAAAAGFKEAKEAVARLQRPVFDPNSAAGQAAAAAYQRGEQAYWANNFAQALPEYRRAGDAGHPGAQYALANMYFDGKGVTRDFAQAYAWALKAAEQNNADAQNLLGYMYGTGTGAAQDHKTAVGWYAKAATNGSANGMFNMGIMNLQGLGTDRNPTLGISWLEKAARAGYLAAAYSLGSAYAKGDGVAVDRAKALQWYQFGANQGHAPCMTEVGKSHGLGLGTPVDFNAAVDWFRRAAEKNDALGMNYLGYHYEKGWGVPRDRDLAVSWYEKAAKLGLKEAHDNLVRLLKIPTDEPKRP